MVILTPLILTAMKTKQQITSSTSHVADHNQRRKGEHDSASKGQ